MAKWKRHYQNDFSFIQVIEMIRKQPGIPKLPHITEEPPPVSFDLYPNPPLTEEQKKWPIVPLSKMRNTKLKSKPESTSEKQPSDPS